MVLFLIVLLAVPSLSGAFSLTNENADPGVWIDQPPQTPAPSCQFAMEQAMREIERYLIDPEVLKLERGQYGVVLSMDAPTYWRYRDDKQFFDEIKAQCWKPER